MVMKKSASALFGILLFFGIIQAQPGAFSLKSPVNGGWANASQKFTWDASSGVTYYQLWIDDKIIRDSILTATCSLTTRDTLTNNLHTWYMKAVDGTGLITKSTETWSLRYDNTPPNAITLLSPGDNQWDSILVVKWSPANDAISGIKYYQIFLDDAIVSMWLPTSTSLVDAQWRHDNIIEPSVNSVYLIANGNSPNYYIIDRVHRWRVVAFDSANNSTSSPTYTVNIDNTPPGFSYKYSLAMGYSSNLTFPNRISNPTQSVTVEAWICPNGSPEYSSGIIWSNYDALIFNNGFGIETWNLQASFKIFIMSGTTVKNIELYSKKDLPQRTWSHVAGVYDGKEACLYVNGILVDSYIVSGTINVSNKPFVNHSTFRSYLNELRLWNTARTQSEINQYKNISLYGNEPDLLGYWRLNEPCGEKTTLLDYSKYKNDVINIYTSVSPYFGNVFGGLSIPVMPTYNQYLDNSTKTFSWTKTFDNGSGFKKYQFILDGTLLKDNMTDTFFTLTTPLTDGIHYWWVIGYDNVGNNQSTFHSPFYIDIMQPNQPQLALPLDSSSSAIFTPTFTWHPCKDDSIGSGIKKYQLKIDGLINIDSISSKDTSTSPSSILGESTHPWSIIAVDGVGNTRESATRILFIDFIPPNSFTLISPTKSDTIRGINPKFIWAKSLDANSGIKKYVLFVSGQTPDTIKSIDTTVIFPKELPNGIYSWYVIAYDGANNTRSSDTGTFIINTLPPSVPILLSPEKSSIQSIMPVLKWHPASNANTYRIQVATDSTFNSSSLIIDQKNIVDTTYSVSNALQKNVIYYWRVNDTNTTLASGWSETWNFLTLPPIPSVISLVSPLPSTTIKTDSITFIWNKSNLNIDHYFLEISVYIIAIKPSSGNGFSETYVDSSIVFTDSMITDTTKGFKDTTKIYKALSSIIYRWRVKAHNLIGWGIFSERQKIGIYRPATAVLPKTFDLKKFSMNNKAGLIHFALPTQCHVSLNYYDFKGRLVASFINTTKDAGYYSLSIPVSLWSRGSYIQVFKAGEIVRKDRITIM
jgi:hypothetical protein